MLFLGANFQLHRQVKMKGQKNVSHKKVGVALSVSDNMESWLDPRPQKEQ